MNGTIDVNMPTRLEDTVIYCIRLNISPDDREDAWDLFRLARRYGGAEVGTCCFGFASEDEWLSALEAFQCQFGPEFFHAFKLAEPCD